MAILLLENGGEILLENSSIWGIELETTPICEFKIVNNLLVDSNRSAWIGGIYNALAGIEFHPFTSDTNGLGYFEIGDRILVTDPNNKQYSVLVLDIVINITGGIMETISAGVPNQTVTNYSFAGVIGQKITNTEIVVNKQQGEIDVINSDIVGNTSQITVLASSINSSVSNITNTLNGALTNISNNTNAIATTQTNITTLNQTATNIQAQISHLGGVNLIKNSVGLKGNLNEWQLFDNNGSLIDSRNNGNIDQSTDTINNTESGSAINLQNQYILETFSTIIGQNYTLYLRYKDILAFNISLTGITTFSPTISSTWNVLKFGFTATGNLTTLKIENLAGANATISDIVVKLGDASGWIQAPNEAYGKNFTFDKFGFSVTSLTDPFKAVLDEQKLTMYDTSGGGSRIVMQVSKDSGLVTQLTVQDQFTLQRYNNPASELRIIPTDKGAMLIIND